MDFKVRVLDERLEYAETMSDLFIPDDVQPGEVLVRKGMIRKLSSNQFVPIALCYYRPENESGRSEFVAYLKENERWTLAIGYSKACPQIISALAAVGVSL